MLNIYINFHVICIILIVINFSKWTITLNSDSDNHNKNSTNNNDNHHLYIHHGKNAELGQIPYQAAFLIRKRLICGGVIISKKYVLTAAHCTDQYKNKLSKISVRVGSIKSKSGGKISKVCKVIQHHNYSVVVIPDYDIAILKLCKSLKFNENVTSISILTEQPSANSTGQISGWGTTERSFSISENLKYANLTVKDRNYCNKFCEKYRQNFTDRMICAEGENKQDVCYGDSGGPIVVNGKLAGLTSWGIRCGHIGYPSMFTNIPYFKDFISKYVKIKI